MSNHRQREELVEATPASREEGVPEADVIVAELADSAEPKHISPAKCLWSALVAAGLMGIVWVAMFTAPGIYWLFAGCMTYAIWDFLIYVEPGLNRKAEALVVALFALVAFLPITVGTILLLYELIQFGPYPW